MSLFRRVITHGSYSHTKTIQSPEAALNEIDGAVELEPIEELQVALVKDQRGAVLAVHISHVTEEEAAENRVSIERYIKIQDILLKQYGITLPEHPPTQES